MPKKARALNVNIFPCTGNLRAISWNLTRAASGAIALGAACGVIAEAAAFGAIDSTGLSLTLGSGTFTLAGAGRGLLTVRWNI